MLDVLIDIPEWQEIALDALAMRAIATTLEHLALPVERAELSLLACDDARIAELNAEFRGKEGATNVLSWPAVDLAADTAGEMPAAPTPNFDGSLELGDIAIAFETCAREAAELGKPLDDHATHLIVHGLLHLLGYDHIRDPDATLMQAMETEILGKMGLDDPYRN
ncbi:rRNA maturation RNase YbeY [Roseobacter sp. YSTF-M11]|uniref:Endoribonuclease YbeY n=1 Tax=Roseobacter insulae TaxID=2859783 RepID=A0A9X1K0J7_9RHOB|nr:rRNA maturation RNase YbeY [Roseobacter insulae]MBW4710340.1 rRNA maturation RNase YbeY [Roseobacter insulae]